jgi:hypothetical protein
MTDEPIFEDIRRTWDQVASVFHHHHPAVAAMVTAQTRKASAMDVSAAVDGIEQHLKSFVTSAEEKLENDLPAIRNFLTAAAPVAAAFGAATHLPFVPEAVQYLADEATRLDGVIAAAQAKGAAEATAAAQAAAAAATVPSEPETPAPDAAMA